MEPGERRKILSGAAAAAGGLACVVYAGIARDLGAAWIGIALLVLGSLVLGLALYADED